MASMLGKWQRRQEVPHAGRGVVVGIDVSKHTLEVAAFRPAERTRPQCLQQNAEGFGRLREFLESLAAQGELWVAFEPTGSYSVCLREWLLGHGYRAVQVNPYHVKRTKEVRDNSPLKTDRKDPQVIADLVWQGCYQPLYALGPLYAELRAASADWKSCQKACTALRNQFQGLLQVWFPELDELFGDRVCQTVRALVRRYESAQAVGAARCSSVRRLAQKVSRGRVNAQRAQAIWRAGRESVAPKAQQMRRAHMLRLLGELDLLEKYQSELKARLQTLLAQLPEAGWLLSLRGIGVVSVACLLGECGELRRYPTYGALEKFVGLNLYEVSSGRQRGRRRLAKRGRSLARWMLTQAAVGQMRPGGLHYEYAQCQKAKGKLAGKIKVAIARKLLALLYALARDGRAFDPKRLPMESRAGGGQLSLQGAQRKAA